jgi:hypothetical protein
MANNKEKSEKYTRRKKKWKKNENKFILILKIFHIAHIPYCTQSIANSFSLFYYYDSISYPFHIYMCMLSRNVLHRVLFRRKCHYVYHSFLLVLSSPHVHDDVHTTRNERRSWSARRLSKVKKAKEEKVFVDVIYFRRGGGYGFQVLFYMLKQWGALFMFFGALFMKKYKIHKTQFLYRRRFFFYYILHKSGIIKQMNQFLMTFPFHILLSSFLSHQP